MIVNLKHESKLLTRAGNYEEDAKTPKRALALYPFLLIPLILLPVQNAWLIISSSLPI